jgi:hypothetical protein
MRVLLAIVLVAAAAWGGWWWWNASTREAAVRDWLAEREAEGWVAEASAIEVDGFPSRVDLTVTELELANPEAGWTWQAPFFQILSLTWTPNHFIAAWPNEQVLATPYDTARIASEVMRGSVVFEPGLDLALDRSTVEIEGMAVTGEAGWSAALDEALLSVRQAEGEGAAPNAYDLSFVAENLALPEAWLAEVDRGGVLPRVMEAAEVDATMAFDRPWDREAVEGESPSLEALALRDLRLSWGRLDLRGRGEVAADAEGFAEGRVDLRVQNWREGLQVAVEGGLIAEGTAQAVETGLGLVAQLSGSGNAIEVPLLFEDGRTLIEAPFGAVPIGEAPRLAGR